MTKQYNSQILLIDYRGIKIPFDGVYYQFSRSAKPGGQNVNKVNSRVTLNFNIINTPFLTDEQKETLINFSGSKVSSEGILSISSQEYRSQKMNRDTVNERFENLIIKCFKPCKKRIPVKVSKAQKEKRIEDKKKRSAIKKARSGKINE